jgi:F0F1-type ATP synthase epsilon subunit
MIPGLIKITDIEDRQIWLGTTGGFCEILNNEVVLLCDSIIRTEELDYDTMDLEPPFFRVDHQKMTEKQKIAYVSRMLAAQLINLKKHKSKG